MKSLEKQINGNHYKNFKIQPIEFISMNNLDFFQGNVIKYICRFREKDGIGDLNKIKHYIDMLIDLEYSSEIKKDMCTVIITEDLKPPSLKNPPMAIKRPYLKMDDLFYNED